LGVLVGQRILLHCDDDPNEAVLLQRALRRSGLVDWVVESVSSGPEALAWLKRAQRGEIPMPDLLALDIRMPKMNGFEVLERLTFNRLKIPPVMLTTSDDVKDRLRARDMGSLGYFVKSPGYSDFVEMLRNWETSPLRPPQQTSCPKPSVILPRNSQL
jgi:CheY-like chemotaxis protein